MMNSRPIYLSHPIDIMAIDDYIAAPFITSDRPPLLYRGPVCCTCYIRSVAGSGLGSYQTVQVDSRPFSSESQP
jgi:hypothetical protein